MAGYSPDAALATSQRCVGRCGSELLRTGGSKKRRTHQDASMSHEFLLVARATPTKTTTGETTATRTCYLAMFLVDYPAAVEQFQDMARRGVEVVGEGVAEGEVEAAEVVADVEVDVAEVAVAHAQVGQEPEDGAEDELIHRRGGKQRSPSSHSGCVP